MAGIKPLIALPYEPKNWNTRNVMKILGKVSMLGMDDITWQLGAGNCILQTIETKHFLIISQNREKLY